LIVVSDSSPVVALARIELLDILPKLYGRAVVPVSVYQEISRPHLQFPLFPERWPWLSVQAVNDSRRLASLSHLDAGEAEAILVAVEIGADLLLMDERKGRKAAVTMGLHVTGLLGILAEAKRAGLIERLAPILNQLTEHADFWLDPVLRDAVLRQVGE